MLYILGIVSLLIMSMPVMMIIGLVVYITDGAPIFFYQWRIGKNNRPFMIIKFRTMHIDAERQQSRLLKQNEASGPVFKIHNDPRYTSFGRFLAHTGLDELPQLWNVLRGDMALIGPRPLPVEEAKKLRQTYQKRHSIKPGIISPWIVEGYHSQTFDAWMKSDLAYIQKKSFWYDAVLSWKACIFLLNLFVHEIV